MRILTPRLSTLTLLATFGCSPVQVSTDYDLSVDFDALRNWAWATTANRTEIQDPRVDNSLLEQRIQSAVEAELGGRGYPRVAEPEADFVVAYNVGLREKQDVWSWQTSWTRSSRGGPARSETQIHEYTEGVLILDFLRPQSLATLWRGMAETRVRFAGSPETRENRIRDAVHRLIEEFPPRK